MSSLWVPAHPGLPGQCVAVVAASASTGVSRSAGRGFCAFRPWNGKRVHRRSCGFWTLMEIVSMLPSLTTGHHAGIAVDLCCRGGDGHGVAELAMDADQEASNAV